MAPKSTSSTKPQHTYFEFDVTLEGISPPIWRRFQLSAEATFGNLHHAIQQSFGWGNDHLWEFRTSDHAHSPIAGAPEVDDDDVPDDELGDWSVEIADDAEEQLPDNLRHLADELGEADPATVRRVLRERAADPKADAEELLTLALTLAWSEGVGPFAPPPDAADDLPVPDAYEVPLTIHFGSKGKKTCHYVYDMGDDWWHKVKLKRTIRSEEAFRRRLVDGARACPPEDIGGVWGYETLLTALQEASADELSDLMDDLGDWDPEAFNLEAARQRFDE